MYRGKTSVLLQFFDEIALKAYSFACKGITDGVLSFSGRRNEFRRLTRSG